MRTSVLCVPSRTTKVFRDRSNVPLDTNFPTPCIENTAASELHPERGYSSSILRASDSAFLVGCISTPLHLITSPCGAFGPPVIRVLWLKLNSIGPDFLGVAVCTVLMTLHSDPMSLQLSVITFIPISLRLVGAHSDAEIRFIGAVAGFVWPCKCTAFLVCVRAHK